MQASKQASSQASSQASKQASRQASALERRVLLLQVGHVLGLTLAAAPGLLPAQGGAAAGGAAAGGRGHGTGA